MSRRKGNPMPKRLLNAEFQQLRWNIRNSFHTQRALPDMELLIQNRQRNSSGKPDVVQILSSGDSSTEIQNVYLPHDETVDEAYKLTICDEIYSNNSAGLLGYLSCMSDFNHSASSKSTIQEVNILVKVQDNAHDAQAASSKAKCVCDSERFVNVFATYEQIDSLQFLCNKAIVEVVIDVDDLINRTVCNLVVYLNEKGFTKIDVPSEDPSMKKIYKSMKILMQWLHGPMLPEMKCNITTHYDDQIESVFNALKSKQSATDDIPSPKERTTNLDKLQHPSLVPLLRGYQKRAVHWMIEQEDPQRFALEEKVPHPLWKPISVGDKQACYNPHTGRICCGQIYHRGYPSGGILADEMGLGKTVEVLACILNNPRQAETEIESHKEILQTGINNCPNDSPCSLNTEVNEKEALAIKPAAQDLNIVFLKRSEENRVANAKKRHLPLDSDINGNGKKVKKETCHVSSDHQSNFQQVDKPSPVSKNVPPSNILDKSPLLSDSITSSVTVGMEMVECNDFSTETLKSSKDNVVNESIGSAKVEDVQSESMAPVITVEKHEPPSKGNEITKGVGEVKSIEALPERQLPSTIVEKTKTVRCICGKNSADGKEEVFTCTSCSFSQHPQCIGMKKNTDENYVCPECSLKMPLIESNTTLIVSPVTIAHQWLDEIHRHILPGSLNVMVYEGVAKQGFVYPSVLADNDIIVTNYEVLKRDFYHLSHKKDNHNHRRPKRYASWPCPLTGIKFWRICLDEAQMVENTTAKIRLDKPSTMKRMDWARLPKTLSFALPFLVSLRAANVHFGLHAFLVALHCSQMKADTRLAMTTPGIALDIFGLFLFLGVEPYYRKTWWKKLLYEPFLRGDPKPLTDVLYNVMWRTAKKDVIDEINLPDQKELMNWLNFSPVEYHFYCRQYEECSTSALKELNKFQEAETQLNSLGSYSAHKVLWPLLRLRQACCHPRAVHGGYLTMQKSMVTMDQLLESLINKAKIESQDAHRLLLCALNGLAGTYILRESWQHAVDVYREAIASWKEHEELFKTDSLQKLHTLHNLNELLQKFKSNTRTLRDDFLQEEAFEIRDKYLQKWRDQVKTAENEANDALQAHEEAKKKVDLKCPWWMTYLENIIDSEKNQGDKSTSERLVDKVKSDLTAGRNVQEYDSLSIADSFSDLRGLQLLLFQKFERIEDCQNNLFKELKNLMVEPTEELVVFTAECCLRPAVDSTAESCCFCKMNDTLSVYESLIFGHQGIKSNETESIGGLRAETEVVRALKSINAYLKSEIKRHYKHHVELQQQAQCHLEYLDLIQKNFKVYRQLWHALRGRVTALDELAMCTMRLRVRYPGEIVAENQTHVIDPTQVEMTQMGFCSDKTIANSRLRKSLGHLLYLKNLAKTKSTDSGENSELCPICTKILGYQWSVFSCGHCLCCECIWVLLERPDFPGRASSYVRCPMCRENTMVQDISYVSTIRQLTEEDKDLVVKGSHSTKIEAAVRTLMRIQKTDPQAKTLVFSTWQDVLDVISRALSENNLKFRSIKKSKDFESSLEAFKKSDDISILLLPLQSGSNGLNIIEATHVILVEPSLNPSLERQAVGRIHRIGQTKPTFIHRLLIANTVEEKIMRFLQNKAESGLRCGTRRTDGENIPLTVGELTSFFQSPETY